MEECSEILVATLAKSGVSIPSDVSSIRDLTASSLFSVCSDALRLIEKTTSFPTSLPEESMSERFKLCSDLASSFTSLGFIGDISFHKFLYPSEEDLYKLVRFLVEKLPGSSEAGKYVVEKSVARATSVGSEELNDGSISHSQILGNGSLQVQSVKSVLQDKEEVRNVENSGASADDCSKNNLATTEDVQGTAMQLKDVKICHDEATHPLYEQHGPEDLQNLNTLDEHSFEISRIIGRLLSEEALLMAEFNRRSAELQDLVDEHNLFKSAVEMAFDDKHPTSFYQKQISDQMQAKRQNLQEVESQWEATKASMEAKCICLEESVAAKLPEAFKKLELVKKIELEMESLLTATKQRDEELLKLNSDLEKQLKLAPRKSYIDRIKEITKNSRKQDIDIEGILKETRELQLESNSIQERLHRTYAVVDETVFRVAKKDPEGQQLYRLLASIHGNFEQMAESILATDRTRREAADYEAKLAAITSRSVNLDKLKADLDAIRKENDLLQQRINPI